jgi:hypothetical protein
VQLCNFSNQKCCEPFARALQLPTRCRPATTATASCGRHNHFKHFHIHSRHTESSTAMHEGPPDQACPAPQLDLLRPPTPDIASAGRTTRRGSPQYTQHIQAHVLGPRPARMHAQRSIPAERKPHHSFTTPACWAQHTGHDTDRHTQNRLQHSAPCL